jgi:ABC-type uncharacterized transport system permease subunit
VSRQLADAAEGATIADEAGPSGGRRLVALYAGLVRAELQAASAYRAQLVLQAFAWVVPLAFLALWRGASSNGPVQGITSGQFATYFCLLLVTTSLQIIMPVIFGFGHLVYTGELSALLLRPCHALHTVVARALAEKVYRLPPLLVLVPVALVLTGGSVQVDPMGWVVAVAVTLLGTVATTYLAAMAAALAFWMTKAQGVQGLLVGAEWILGGIVAPAALLPWLLPDLIRHQPLWFADAAAPEILSGISSPEPWLVAEAALWVLVLHLGYRMLWRRALRRYEAVGT